MKTNDFWLFATHLYGEPGVADACLWLQEQYDLDVMLLLLCLWSGYEWGPLHPAQLHMLINDSEPWRQNLVRPLRSARRWLKKYRSAIAAPSAADSETLRQAILDNELVAERLQGELLQALLAAWQGATLSGKPGAAAAESNVHLYLKQLSIALDPGNEQRLKVILTASPRPA
ncbi:MAG: TIGR02444 family protein [Porticoccaceae bacterium]|nr:TIGR02444 family protein [Porticoccaceae bacterium]